MDNQPVPVRKAEDFDFSRESLRLTRYSLGLIDIADLMQLDKDPAGDGEIRNDYAGRMAGVMEILERELKYAMAQQLDFTARHAANWEQVIMGRGAISLIDVLWERFQQFKVEHEQHIADLKESNQSTPPSNDDGK